MARVQDVGYRAASEELGIPLGTLTSWVFKARQREGRRTERPRARGLWRRRPTRP